MAEKKKLKAREKKAKADGIISEEKMKRNLSLTFISEYKSELSASIHVIV
jgi:hypothetical protein